MAGDSYTLPETALADESSRDEPLLNAATLWMLAALAVLLLFSLAQASLPAFVAFVTFGGGGLVLARTLGVLEMRVFAVAFGFASIAAVALYLYYEHLYGVPYFLGGSDELEYERYGEAFAKTLGVFDYTDIRGNLVPVWHNSVAYIYVVGLLDKFALLFGEVHSMVPRLFNAALLGLSAAGIYRIGARLELPRNLAIGAGLFAGCLPMMVYVSVQTLRDIFVSTLLIGVVCLWTAGRRRKLPMLRAALLTLLTAAMLIDMRRQQAAVALMVGIVGFLSSDNARRPIVWVPTVIVTIVAIVATYVALSAFFTTEVLSLIGQSDYYSEYRVEEVGGGLSTIVFTTPPPLGWLLRTGYALMTPIPEPTLELDKIWIGSGTITQIMFVPFLFAGLGAAARLRDWWPVLGAMLMLFIGMAMFTFQGRHIVQYLPFAVLLAALGYQRLERSRASIFTFTASLGVVLAVIYVLLKL